MLSALEARERANPIQINAEVRPEKTIPSEPCNRITSDEYRKEPELLAVVQPNVCVAEQAASDPAGINGKCGRRHLRHELRWRSRRRLNASRCTPGNCPGFHPETLVPLVLQVLLARQVRLVRLGILEILRRHPVLEKIPYVIAPFNE